ncbi:MAG: imelysin family protein [Myxococcota bacterium]
MQRRTLLEGALGLTLTQLAQCKRPGARERALIRVAKHVASGVDEVLDRSRTLERALDVKAGELTGKRLDNARSAFREAALSWRRVGTFRDGPFQENNALARATRFPARPRVIEAVLAETRPLDATRIAELGSGEKGLYAIEYLLFHQAALSRFTGANGARVTALCHGLASELVGLAEKIKTAVGRRGSHLEDELLANPQSSLSRLVNTLIEGLELMAEGQLGLVFRLSEVNRLDPIDVEGYASKLSHRLALARFEGAERLYRGEEHDISSLVRNVSPNADASVQERFDKALRAMQSLNAPLEELAQRERSRLHDAYLKVKSLEAGMKVHLPSALGITITFSSTDAD